MARCGNTQPSLLSANSFFNNRSRLGNPVTHFNRFGATAGGPVVIPRVFNGKDKLFWFFAHEGNRNSQPFTSIVSVPRKPNGAAISPRFSRSTARSSTIRTTSRRTAAPSLASRLPATRSRTAASAP